MSDQLTIPLFDIDRLTEDLETIKIFCIEKTYSESDFDNAIKIILAYNNIKTSIKCLDYLQKTIIELNKK